MEPKAHDASQLDINVDDPSDQPKDTVSSIVWAPSGNSPTFATSDWDSQIRIYRVKQTPDILVQDAQYDAKSPCLSVSWHDDETQLFAGCADGTVKLFDIASGGKCQEIGKHNKPVKSVHWVPSTRNLVTVSFDQTIRLWDPRQDEKEVAYHELAPDKPFCSDLLFPYLAVGLNNEKALVMDLASPVHLFHYVNCPLGPQTQITMIKLSQESNGKYGIGFSGNDGRSNISKIIRNQFEIRLESVVTFKVPEKVRNGETRKYPVNCIGFHPHRGSQFIFTGEGDGRMFFWDSIRKGRIAEFDFKGNAITQAEIDPTGKYMAYSLGYDWARGIEGYMSQPSKVCVHELKEKELEYQYQGDQNYPIVYP